MNICEHLTVTARLFPEKVALIFEDSKFTYSQLDQLSVGAAKRLNDLGITRGDRVALSLPNVPAFIVWYYAALRLGSIAVSVSTRLAENEVGTILEDCEAKILVTDAPPSKFPLPSCVSQALQVNDDGTPCDGMLLDSYETDSTWIDAHPNDPALILYTSGTTGMAKGVTLSHLNVRSNVEAFNHLCHMQQTDHLLLAVPLFHCFGQNALLNSAFHVGATLVLQRKFDLQEAKRLILEQRVTQLYGVPMMFQLLLESYQPQDLDSVTYCFSAAAPLPTQVSQRWQEKFGLPINEGYGLTETSPFASYNHRLQYTLGSIGTPIDAVEMQIVDTETKEPCPAGELGEIAIRGPNVMLGYWNRPEETAAAVQNGWFFSGDIGRQDERGFFYIVDRVKDMIAVGGMKVYPAEVERVLLDHTAVSQVAVVGKADSVFGEQVVAFVVPDRAKELSKDFTDELRQFARQNLANFKVPQHVVLVDELPRNPSGKILKTQLREYDLSQARLPVGENNSEPISTAPLPSRLHEPVLRTQLAAAHAASRRQHAIEFVQELVRSLSDAEDLPTAEARFLDAGLDSLLIVEMSSQIQAEVGDQIEVPATLVFDYPRVCDLADFLITTLYPEVPTDSPTVSSPQRPALREQIEAMSEEEALAELMREL